MFNDAFPFMLGATAVEIAASVILPYLENVNVSSLDVGFGRSRYLMMFALNASLVCLSIFISTGKKNIIFRMPIPRSS